MADDCKKVILLIGKFDAEHRLPRELILQIPDLKEQALALFVMLESQSSHITFFALGTMSTFRKGVCQNGTYPPQMCACIWSRSAIPFDV